MAQLRDIGKIIPEVFTYLSGPVVRELALSSMEFFVLSLRAAFLHCSVRTYAQVGDWYRDKLRVKRFTARYPADLEKVMQMQWKELFHLQIIDVPTPLPPGLQSLPVGVLVLPDEYNEPIHPGMIPKTVFKILFGNRFNSFIHPGALPAGIELIVFGDDFRRPITSVVFPKNCTVCVDDAYDINYYHAECSVMCPFMFPLSEDSAKIKMYRRFAHRKSQFHLPPNCMSGEMLQHFLLRFRRAYERWNHLWPIPVEQWNRYSLEEKLARLPSNEQEAHCCFGEII